jgi:hypothetical protein
VEVPSAFRTVIDRLSRPPAIAAAVSIAVSIAFAACTQSAPPPGAQATTVAANVQAVATAAPAIQAASTPVAATVQAASTQVAGAVSAVASAVAPTISAVQTQAAPAVSAAQTQAAPTISAAQTQIAPTAAALSTQVAGTVQPAIATSVANSPVQISQVKVDPADTTISIHNTSQRQVSVGGWILFMGTFPFILPTNSNMRIDPGATVTLHFSRGTDTATDVYVGQAPTPLVNNLQNGATLALVDLSGQVASVYRIP